MSKRCIVLHSGGLDSTLCLLLARQAGREPLSLGISYGQRQTVEIEYAERQCARFGFERRLVEIKGWDKPHIDVPTGRTMDEMRAGIAPTFLPGRNAVFLAIAAAEAAGAGAEEVWIGVNAVDYSGYPDCRESFLAAFRAMWEQAVPGGPKVVAPLVNLTKPQIAALAGKLGLKPGDTWSCYAPVHGAGSAPADGGVPCGVCDACILHEHAWAEAAQAEAGAPAIP